MSTGLLPSALQRTCLQNRSRALCWRASERTCLGAGALRKDRWTKQIWRRLLRYRCRRRSPASTTTAGPCACRVSASPRDHQHRALAHAPRHLEASMHVTPLHLDVAHHFRQTCAALTGAALFGPFSAAPRQGPRRRGPLLLNKKIVARL